MKHSVCYNKQKIALTLPALALSGGFRLFCLIEASGRPAFTCRRSESDGTFIDKMKSVFEEAEENAPSIVFA